MVFGGIPQYDMLPDYGVVATTTTSGTRIRGDCTEGTRSSMTDSSSGLATVAQPSTANQTRKVLATTSRMELSDAAKRAHARLQANSDGKGIISSDGVRLYPHPMSYNRAQFEFNFDRPEQCVIIPRDFFPDVGTDSAIRTCAIRHAESQDERHIQEMFCLINELRNEIREVIKLKIRWHFMTHIQLAKIPYQNRFAANKEEVFKAWATCNPDRFLIEKFHNLLYDSFSPEVYDSMTYDIYLDFGLWLDKAADGALLTNKNAGDHKARACSVRRMAVMIGRDYVRGRYTRKSIIPHGIILTISRDSDRLILGRRKRKKGTSEFEFKRFVKGWRSPKHLLYCKENNFTVPSIPELEDGMEVESSLQPVLFESTRSPNNTVAQATDSALKVSTKTNNAGSAGLASTFEDNENIRAEEVCIRHLEFDGRIILTYSCKFFELHKRQKMAHFVSQLPPMGLDPVRGS